MTNSCARVGVLSSDIAVGGGWTLVGRGRGTSRSCWLTSSDCQISALAAGNAWNTGPTTRLSDGKINSLTYTRILWMGTGPATSNGGNNYWYGKDKRGGGCSYRHNRPSSGHCNCAMDTPNGSRRCGRTYPSHRGVGDWPNHGSLHSAHTGHYWFVKNNQGGGGRSCHGQESGCHAALFVR